MKKWISCAAITAAFAMCASVCAGENAPVKAKFTNSIDMDFVRIESGSFLMGSRQGGDWDEKPVHRVTISGPFAIGVTEVTNAQYERFDPGHKALRGKCGYSSEDDEAVVFVSWYDAAAFCDWLSEKEGVVYRLPTEAEWEYACRAGSNADYSTGEKLPEELKKNQEQTWRPEKEISLAVGRTRANRWGLCDMHGNVEEWCYDWYGPYEEGAQVDPVGRAGGDFKISRGGSHSTKVEFLRSANRMGTLPHDKNWLIGFRVVRGELPDTEPLAPVGPPSNARDVKQVVPNDIAEGPNPDEPYFKGPVQYVHIPEGSDGPIYSRHNHDPALVDCPNGDLLAIWYSCRTEQGRELGIVASRLRYGSDRWERASPFWNAPDRNDHAPAMYYDGRYTIYHFNGLGAAATWGNLATVMRVSCDSGATWSKARLINPEHGLRHMPVESVFRTGEGYLLLPCDAVTGGSGGTSIHISRDGGTTWTDPGLGRDKPDFEVGEQGAWIAGIHAGVVQLKNGDLLAFGRGDNIDGHMPQSVSHDMGETWTYSASPFPGIGGGQRLVLRRLSQGSILFVSFANRSRGMMFSRADGTEFRGYGMFAALSYDEGKSWPVRRLLTAGGPAREVDGGGNTGKFTMDETHAEPKGYLAATQTPDGLIHLISSKQHYVFNVEWIEATSERDRKRE